MPSSTARYPRPALIGGLVFATTIFVAAVLAGALLLVLNLRDQAFRDDAQRLRNLALLLAQETDRAFFALETVQIGLAEKITGDGVQSPEQFEARLGDYKTFEILRDRAAGMPYLDALTLIEKNGRLVNFSRYWPIPKVNVTDRDYYKALIADPAMMNYLGVPVLNRGTGTWNLYLARKVRASDGDMVGLVLGAVRLAYIREFYDSIDDGDAGVITLVRTDGVMLVTAPSGTAEIGRSYAGPGLSAVLSLKPGTTLEQRAGPFDGAARLFASQRLEHYPVSVVVSNTRAAVNARWIRNGVVIGLGALLMCLVAISCAVLVARQLRIQRRYADAAEWNARHDPLTALPNRLLFHEKASALLRSNPAFGMPVLLLIDLDYFKSINDTLGHPVGDQLLQAIAESLAKLAVGERLIARLGGDEFAVLDRIEVWPDDAVRLGERIIEMVSQTYILMGNRVLVNASVGIASADLADGDIDQLLSHADLALYQAKGEGRGTIRLFEPALAVRAEVRRHLEIDLRQAIKERAFKLHFQPFFDAATGALNGFEALVRWTDPLRGAIPPNEFIPVAEETGMILPLGEWVLNTACAIAAGWPSHLRVAVNVSGRQFSRSEMVGWVREALSMAQLPASRLELEITETVLLGESAGVRQTLSELRGLGVGIALDDFGTGYSSLGYLRYFPVERLKIDQGFVADIATNSKAGDIVRSLIALGHSLGMQITAEGVETAAQCAALQAAGCDELQGYLLGKPVPEEAVSAVIEQARRGMPGLRGPGI